MLNISEIDEETKAKVNCMIDYAKEQVPFYNNLYKNHDDIEDIPIITKDTILKSNLSLMASKYIIKSDRVASFQTSGSTGKCFCVKWDKPGFNKSMFDLWSLRYKYYGIKPNDKFCYFYSNRNFYNNLSEEWFEINKSNSRLGFDKHNLNDDILYKIFEKINEFKPVWLNLQPTIGIIMADFMKNKNLSLPNSVKYIEFTGEYIDTNTFEFLKNTFKCTISNQYGTHEFNSIAFMCPNGHLHIIKNNVFVEIDINNDKNEHDDKGYGDIIVTSLHNKCMPFIRYNTGDIGKIEKEVCEYNKYGDDILVLKRGRQCDNAVLEDGSKVNFYVFAAPVEKMNEKFGNIIRQFRIIQKETGLFLVIFCLDNELCKEEGLDYDIIEDIYLNNINENNLMDAEFEFMYSDELLPDEETGKLRYFIKNTTDNVRV